MLLSANVTARSGSAAGRIGPCDIASNWPSAAIATTSLMPAVSAQIRDSSQRGCSASVEALEVDEADRVCLS
jgi:hypothetical protein